jgi:hypothetical protein
MMSSFQERHAGQALPPMGRKGGEEKVITKVPEDRDLIPLSIQGVVIPVTEAEALGVIGQITAILQTRRPGVYTNGR